MGLRCLPGGSTTLASRSDSTICFAIHKPDPVTCDFFMVARAHNGRTNGPRCT